MFPDKSSERATPRLQVPAPGRTRVRCLRSERLRARARIRTRADGHHLHWNPATRRRGAATAVVVNRGALPTASAAVPHTDLRVPDSGEPVPDTSGPVPDSPNHGPAQQHCSDRPVGRVFLDASRPPAVYAAACCRKCRPSSPQSFAPHAFCRRRPSVEPHCGRIQHEARSLTRRAPHGPRRSSSPPAGSPRTPAAHASAPKLTPVPPSATRRAPWP